MTAVGKINSHKHWKNCFSVHLNYLAGILIGILFAYFSQHSNNTTLTGVLNEQKIIELCFGSYGDGCSFCCNCRK